MLPPAFLPPASKHGCFCLFVFFPSVQTSLVIIIDIYSTQSSSTGGMDVTSSPVNKQAQSRAARTSSNQKSNRETLVQKDKPAPRSKENPATARNEPSQGPCKTFPDKPGERKRGRSSKLTRLSGRTSSGERGKGQAGSFQLASSSCQIVLMSLDGSRFPTNLTKIDRSLETMYPLVT